MTKVPEYNYQQNSQSSTCKFILLLHALGVFFHILRCYHLTLSTELLFSGCILICAILYTSEFRLISFLFLNFLFRSFVTLRPLYNFVLQVFSDTDDVHDYVSLNKPPPGVDPTMEEEYASLSRLLMEFTTISDIEKAWVLNSGTGAESKAMFYVRQPNMLANESRRFLISANIPKDENPTQFRWSPFPIEMSGVSIMVPSPSGSKLVIIRNLKEDSPCKFEIWGESHLEKEFHIPQSVHGSVYQDKWFEGVSWNSDETLVAYVAEEPVLNGPTFDQFCYKVGGSADKGCNTWKGQGDYEEGWGEAYANKRRPTLFVIDTSNGEVRPVKGISRSLSVGQVVWAPSDINSQKYLVFVGWSAGTRKHGIKYCRNRPCGLYLIQCPFGKLESSKSTTRDDDSNLIRLTEGIIISAFFPRFSQDGKSLVFLSAKSAVDSGVHAATQSLHRIDWPCDLKSPNIIDVVPVVLCPKDCSFPGLYCTNILNNPWLSNGRSIIISSMWRSAQVILSVDINSGEVLRISPPDSSCSWNLIALDKDNILAVCSSVVAIPQIKYGHLLKKSATGSAWSWNDVCSPIFKCSMKVRSLLSSLELSIVKIPVRDTSEKSTQGARQPFEAILVCSKDKENDVSDPLVVVLHGGPHDVASTAFCKSLAFLSSIGYSLLVVNYRGSLGFGEEALQSLPGNVGNQDVNDVLTAIDHIVDMKLARPSKIAAVGISHGGFLSTHLIGQAPEMFSAAAARNPVCNLELMVGTSDIPNWCFVGAYGSIKGKSRFTEAPTLEDLNVLYTKSPISHIHKVKTPTLFLLGAQDLRVPISNGLQYAWALKERGVEVKTIVFPDDIHPIDRPQSDFESFLNIGVWFNKYCK